MANRGTANLKKRVISLNVYRAMKKGYDDDDVDDNDDADDDHHFSI